MILDDRRDDERREISESNGERLLHSRQVLLSRRVLSLGAVRRARMRRARSFSHTLAHTAYQVYAS